ncbi:MAG: EscU/YscU/HrcU family type III secretion system export apparatus switch protein [Terriglobales bacterium]
MADSSKTEPGTPKKREDARKEGQIARGRDLPGAVAVLAAIAVMAWFSGSGMAQWRRLLEGLLAQATAPGATMDALTGLAQLRQTFLLALIWSGVVAAAAWVCATAVAFQGGFIFSGSALLKFDRLQPMTNLKNMFSLSTLSRTARSIIPVAVMAYLTYGVILGNWGKLLRASDMSVSMGLAWVSQLGMSMAWRGGAVLLGWAGVDYLMQHRSHENALKMTKQEVKQDAKETQGSPETRGRIRRLQRQMARRRMMQEVPKAAVVITNPTHFAVALRYDPETMAAPVVVAKGQDRIAARIRALAVSAGVPIVENREVARALYALVDLGAPIPGTFYAAVAEILAYLRRAAMARAR